MKKLVEKDKQIKHLKEMIIHLESVLEEETNDVLNYQSQNPYLIDVAKKCIDNRAIKNKSDLLKIEILEKVYTHLGLLEKTNKLSREDKGKIKDDKKNINKILNSLYDEI